jgi:hypothetical protein
VSLTYKLSTFLWGTSHNNISAIFKISHLRRDIKAECLHKTSNLEKASTAEAPANSGRQKFRQLQHPFQRTHGTTTTTTALFNTLNRIYTMKTSPTLVVGAIAATLTIYSQFANSFTVAPPGVSRVTTSPAATTTSSLSMFSGGGAGAPKEDNPEEQEGMRKMAEAMGVDMEGFKLAMAGRARLEQTLDSTMVSAGKADSVFVERDLNKPPKKLDITITAAGKAKGKDALAKELVAALKSTSDQSNRGRVAAQQEMVKWITSQG